MKNLKEAKVKEEEKWVHSIFFPYKLITFFLLFERQIARHDSFESIFELLIGRGVAKWINGTIEIAEEVRQHVQVNVNTRRAKRGQDRNDVIRSPTRHKSTQDKTDGLQSLFGSIFRF